MVQVVVLAASGEQRTIKVTTISGAGIAKALRKTTPAELIGTYTGELSVWGWRDGTTENTHELPPMTSGETPVLFGDVVIAATGDFTESDWTAFYQEYTYEEEEDAEDAEAEVEADEEEAEEGEEGEAEEGEEAEEAEEGEAEEGEEAEEAEAEDGDCYDERDENGGGAKRRINKRRSVASEYRRMEMGLKARVKLPVPPGKRAPRWQTTPELEEEGEFTAQREQVLGVITSRVELATEHCADLELGIYTASLQEAERKGVRRHWENPDFAMIYSIVARKVLANLDPAAYVGNARLIQRLQDGEFTARQIAFMSPKELYPEHWQPLADAQTKRENIMLEGDKEGGSDMFKCKRCGKSKTKYWEMQTRSADEPMTIFIRCLNCGKEWRQ